MKALKVAVTSLAVLLLVVATGNAVTYPFHRAEAKRVVSVLCNGSEVTSLQVADILPVYREESSETAVGTRPVGTLRILGQVDNFHFQGEVLSGQVQPGDLARKGMEVGVVTSVVGEPQ